MKIQYLAHASFLITTESGTRIVTDPFNPSAYPDNMSYKAYNGPADIVTISHDHPDHAALDVIKGAPIVIKGNGKFIAEGVEFLGIQTYHDGSKGEQRGKNTVYVIRTEELSIAHMGDLGHVLTSDQAAEIGNVDIALIPVGGYYTIDAEQAAKVADQVAANIIIPMHYKTEKCNFPIESVDSFLAGKQKVIRQGGSVLEVTKYNLPQEQQIIVLDYSL